MVPTGNQRDAKPIAVDLVTAIRNADAQVVRKLLDDGADVNARDAEGNTPLILAARRAGNSRTVKLLLQRGANATERNDAGVGPVLSAAAIRMDWLQPGIAPTVKRVEVPMVAIVQFEGDKVANEHIYWDQASLLVQVGLLDRTLPVRGGEIAAQVLNPTQPMNELIRRAPNPTPWAER